MERLILRKRSALHRREVSHNYTMDRLYGKPEIREGMLFLRVQTPVEYIRIALSKEQLCAVLEASTVSAEKMSTKGDRKARRPSYLIRYTDEKGSVRSKYVSGLKTAKTAANTLVDEGYEVELFLLIDGEWREVRF